MNRELARGATFRSRARDLKEYLREQPTPYRGTDKDLARALFIGERTIARYLRLLRGFGHIWCITTHGKVGEDWRNCRAITLTPKSKLGFLDEEPVDYQI